MRAPHELKLNCPQLSSAQLSSAQLSSAQLSSAQRFDSRGMSLIEVLIAVGIMGIMLMTMTAIFQGQARETQALTEKLAALDFQRTVIGAISVAASCGKDLSAGNLAPGQSLTFDPAGITSTDKNNPNVIAKLQKIYGMDGASVLADSTAANPTVSPLSSNLKLRAGSGMELAAYKDPTSGQLVYQLLLVFDNSALVRPIHNLAMIINATTLAAGSNIQVTGCIGASAPVAPSALPGTLCGNRAVLCRSDVGRGSSGSGVWVSYDQQCDPSVCMWKSTNVACQDVTLTATCAQKLDPVGNLRGVFIDAVYGCPSGWSGAHTMTSFDAGVSNSVVQENGYIYCVKN